MKVSIEELIKIYLDVKNVKKTAELSGYSKSGIHYWLDKRGVEKFKINRAGIENPSRKSISKLNEDHPRKLIRNYDYMFDLYVVKKFSLRKIGKILKLDSTTVLTGLKQCGIKRRTRKDSLKGVPKPNVQGSKNRNWKGGITGWRKLARGRLNEHFVRPVMERDNFVCQWCGSNTKLVVHHHNRSFNQIVNLIKEKIPESEIEKIVSAIVSEHKLEDGITLCKICHDKFHKEFGKK